MGLLDAFWHLLNLFGPAVGVGLIAPGLAKLLWRSDLRGQRWRDLAGWTTGAGALVLLLGLVLQARDGRMATYAAMVAACAGTLWWRGWGQRRRV